MGTTATGPMTGPLDQTCARAALERVLAAGVFDRAPNLELILRYVCEKYFAGKIDEIKEYNIAIDALGRPAGFDQKRDSIVRVEAHRLRKRLADYYAAAGLADPVEIRLPAGTYVPQFLVRQSGLATPVPEQEVEPPEAPPPVDVAPAALPTAPVAPAALPWKRVGLILVLLAAATAFIYRSQTPSSAKGVPIAPPPPEAVAASPGEEIRILAGSTRERTADHLGNMWLSDRYVTGGDVRVSPTRPISRTANPAFYLQRREGDFRYDIPVRPGVYEVRLHFAETVFGEGNIAGGGESSRVFALFVNDQERPEVVDALSNAGGPNTAWIRVLRDVKPASDGKIHLRFSPFAKEQPFVNGIEVIPTTPGAIRPVRIVARSSPYTDTKRQFWAPDQFFEGGMYVQRHEPVAGTTDIELFQGERYGNFTYSIPVDPKSHYTVTLRFVESWFGPGRPGGGGAGSRIFDVYSGGRTLLRRFDIYKEAGGPLKGIVKTFRGLEPTAQGRLVLQFVPVENYALINSIEVVDEGK